MNAARTLIVRNQNQVLGLARRNMSDLSSRTAVVDGYKVVGLPNLTTRSMRWNSFKKAWLSDPSCFPIAFVLGFACVFCTGVGGACLAYNPDVQINPVRRNKVIRDWDY